MPHNPSWLRTSVVIAGLFLAPTLLAAKQEGIDAILRTSTSLAFADVPLIEALATIAKTHRIPIVLHQRSVAEANLQPNAIRVSGRFQNQTLDVVLSKLTQPHRLAWFVRHEAVLITSATAAETAFHDARVYRLRRNVSPDRRARSIMANVAPMSWANVGGRGDAAPLLPNLVVVYQAPAIQHDIAELYASSMTLIRAPSRDMPPRDRLQQQLEQPTHFDFHNLPFRDVLKNLSQRHGVAIQMDDAALRAANFVDNELVTMRCQDLRSLAAGLSLLLEVTNEKLRWIADEHEIRITTVEAANSKMILRTYDVTGWTLAEGFLPREDSLERVHPRENSLDKLHAGYKPLIEAIQFTISPADWEDVGGNGSIREGSKPQTLEISQSYPLHCLIERLLQDLRAGQTARDDPAAGESP